MMRKLRRNGWIRGVGALLLILCLFAALSPLASGADDSFEKQIAAFPDSYKPYLRQLHKQYPKWIFEPFETGLDFNTVVEKEYGKRSLVHHSSSSDYLKSHDVGYYEWVDKKVVDFYDYSTGSYIYMDGGFVTGNQYAVAYYIDPRNFLDEENIFQFEDLGFSDTFTVKSVESVLSGTYMYNAPMNYLNTEGETVKVKKTYAEAIYEAGKKYNVNPCYLASKIRNEVGNDGSGSSLGNRKDYPGIYNLYNIGAYDGGDAIAKCLKWASGSNGYGTPWTSPEKSISGGAKYIAEKYIAIGQFTGYLQRFNVNPDSEKPVYTHQYMTNLTGALSQGYSNYSSYVKMDLLNREIRFSIPVYKNMPAMSSDGSYAQNADSFMQKGKISASLSYVRTGPSTNNAKLYDGSNVIQLTKGVAVEILDKVKTDADYYLTVLQYPFWYNIRFTYNSKTFEGFVPADFVEITDTTRVSVGKYKLPLIEGGDLSLKAISRNTKIAKVTDDGEIEFLKKGKVEIITYNSTGEFDLVVYDVVSDAGEAGSLSVKKNEGKLKYTLDKSGDAEKYQFALYDEKGKLVKKTETANNYYTFSGLKSGVRYYCYARPVFSDGYGAAVGRSALTMPDTPEGFTAVAEGDSVIFSWKTVNSADSYCVFGYNEAENTYTSLGKTTDTSLEVSGDRIIYDSYCIRAYASDSVASSSSSYSEKIVISGRPSVPTGFEVSEVTTDGYILSWNNSFNAVGYRIYAYDEGEGGYTLLADTKETIYTVKGKKAGTVTKYKLKSYNSEDTSVFSRELSVSTLPQRVEKFNVSDITTESAVLTWSGVKGAVLYRVYSGATLVTETKELSHKLEGLSQMTSYTLRVVACTENLDEVFEGEGAELTVLTKLKPVNGFKCAESGYNFFTVEWKENTAADHYFVYLYNSDGKQIAKERTGETFYTFENLDSDKVYYVKVLCQKIIDGKKYNSASTDKIKVETGTAPPIDIEAASVTATSYTVKWKAVRGAYSYRLYKKTGDGYELFAEVKDNSYKVSGLSSGSKSTYKLTTRVKVGSKYYESPMSDAFSLSTKPAKVKSLKAGVAVTTTTVSWKKVNGADCYKIYLYDTESKKYVCKATVTGTSYKLRSLSPGTSYKYAVRAYAKPSTGAVSGSNAYGEFMTKPSKVAKVSVSSVKATSHVLSWDKAEGANFYYIYRYDTAKKSYINVGGTTKTSYTVKSLVSATTYKYKVVSAVLEGGECVIKGSASEVYSFTTSPVKVKSLKVKSATDSTIVLTWAGCDGADGYEVYYYDEYANEYFKAGTTDVTTFTMERLSSGRTVSVKVRAYCELKGEEYYGVFSSALTAKTK